MATRAQAGAPGLFGGDSVAEVLDRNRGIGPGFDIWRVLLSVLVILLHSFHVSYGKAPWLATGWSGPLWAAILPIFFGLSGFLVSGSAFRTGSLKIFLLFRGLRIVPALAVEVTLAALILGPLLTSFALGDYFTDPKFFTYFGNIVGWVHYELPGVFLDNPKPRIVNQNLWTLHPELASYALMAVLIATGAIRYRRLITALFLGLTLIGAVLHMGFGLWPLKGVYHPVFFVYYFLFGVVFYHWRDRIILNKWLFSGSILIAYALLKLPQTGFLVSVFLMYIMIYVGMLRLPRIDLIQRGDYSYGLYLYAYPIQQTLVMLLPWSREWYLNFPLALSIAFVFSAASWHWIEKPALSLKRHFSFASPPR
jgi:peptidoglycan/LPS O-acetylase OafA/YrhL